MNDMEPLTIVVLGAIVTGLVQVIKSTRGISGFVEGREQVLVLILSVGIGLAYGLDVLSGIIAGLSSMGLYDTTKAGYRALTE